MPWLCRTWTGRSGFIGRGLNPSSERGLCKIRSGEVVDVHLRSQSFRRSVQKKVRSARPSVSPYYVWWMTAVPGNNFSNNAIILLGLCNVGADGKEALVLTVPGSRLDLKSETCPRRFPNDLVRRLPTVMYLIASSSFCWFRATITTLAPFCARSLANPRPMPCEPPVTTMTLILIVSTRKLADCKVRTYSSVYLKMVLHRKQAHDVQC